MSIPTFLKRIGVHRAAASLLIIPLLFGSLVIAPVAHAAPRTADLVGYWTFDEGTGTSAADVSGNGNRGTLANGATWTAGKVGGALQLDGVDDLVRLPERSYSTSDWSVAAWVKTTDSEGWIVGDGEGSDLRIAGGAALFQNYTTSGFKNLYSSTAVNNGAWHHVAAIRTPTELRLYVDGILNRTTPLTGTGAPGFMAVGARTSNTAGSFSGAIDDLRIYRAALSASEVAELVSYAGGSGGGGGTGDTTPPTVGFTAPTQGTHIVRGTTYTFQASASDNVGVASVQFYVDGTALTSPDTSAPYSARWSTRRYALGTHTVEARARDSAGNTSSNSVTVSLDSTTSTSAVPAITTFSASPSAINTGQSATLSWNVTGATSVSINQGVGTVTGSSITVSPTSTRPYTLTATNAAGSVTAVATVTVTSPSSPAAPVISSFTASPATITAGQSATLSWNVTGATSLSINQGVGTVTGTSRVVAPTTTTAYTLTATNSAGSVSAVVTVVVNPLPPPAMPVISSFAATPASITAGQSATLSWNVTGATSVTLSQGIGTVTGNTRTVTPAVTTSYQLTATNAAGSVTAVATVTVIPPPPPAAPVITSFGANPSAITAGQSTTLSWNVTGATTLSLSQGIGTVTGNSRVVTPSTTTAYTLTATNTAGSVTAIATVTVNQPPPPTGACTGSNCVTVNANTTYQTMNGWEATAQAAQAWSPSWNSYKNALLDQAAADGINRLRVEVTSGMENSTDCYAVFLVNRDETAYNNCAYLPVNDNTSTSTLNASGFKWTFLDDQIDQLVLPLKSRLAARGEQLYVNVNYVDFARTQTRPFTHKQNPDEYAEFVKATYDHLQTKYGIVPDSWEVILEPDTSTAQWSSTQVANAIKSAGNRLTAAGITPHFVAPSVTNSGNASSFISKIGSTAGAMPYVDAFSYHLYGSSGSGADADRQSIANAAAANGKKTGMLELIGADYETLYNDLTIANASGWQQFTLSWYESDDGGSYYNTSGSTVNVSSRMRFLRQYFKDVRRGAVRVGAANTGNGNLMPVAFRNTNGTYAVVTKTNGAATFGINGLPAGTYRVYYTTGSVTTINAPATQTIAAGQALSNISIPAQGVITVVGVAGSVALAAPQALPGVAAAPTQAPTVASAAVAKTPITTALQYGSTGSNVASLQQKLQNLGFYTGSVINTFGPATREAVRSFQRVYGIVATGTEATTGYGMVGSRTREFLNSLFR